MAKTNPKRRLNFARILLAPILAIVFLVGWGLSFVGQAKHEKPEQTKKKKMQEQETVTFTVETKEEQTITNQ